MSRTFADDELACVKATSFVSEIAPRLVPPGERALFMFATPRNYIASILAGENSREGAADAGGEPRRAHRRARFGNWAARTRCRARGRCLGVRDDRAGSGGRGDDRPPHLWADFDRMLNDMPAALGRACRTFRLRGR